MARTYPDKPLAGTKSNAERTVFFALKELLPRDYIVLHSVPIYRRDTPVGRLKDGEADFIVIHPDKGLLVIEVKGGEIRREQETGEWFSIGFKGGNRIKDPYDQSKSNVHDLIKDLANERSTRRLRFSYGHAAWFPNVDISKADLKLSSSLQGITLGKEDVENASSAISRLFKNALGEKPLPIGPGEAGAQAIADFLCPSLELSFALASAQKDQERQILQATRSQYRVLTYLKRHNKALICGPAGSGKTFIAMEKIKRIVEADPNARVLMTCFNSNLASMVKETLSPLGQNVDVLHFHGLCSALIKRANLPFPTKDPASNDRAYFEEVLPSTLLDALDCLDSRYDAIIVDEAQDFKPSWWLPIQCLLEDIDEGIFYILFDDNQAIYGDGSEHFPINEEPITLSENCRNTKPISQHVNRFYAGDPPEAIGPEGPDPVFVVISEGQGQENCLQEVLDDLIKKQGYLSNDIIVLTPLSRNQSCWGQVNRVGKHTLKWFDSYESCNPDVVSCCSIYSYKGLEKPVVIVTEMDRVPQERYNALSYVACSRAKALLIVIQ